ncbi:secondary thiamine-phosphate synthase enzyme YjbQ [Notoacmeibacter sp. MSK16QG-6]|uniref:secondary thiamine-phosphate synthase enzyme YjbQ n=1 Tax=Notoacmeibacter sp. MSK16QG-6 TaxID=2957982 RepID=UPI00209DF3D7|nr:secondary thiamine-phosphate synthase enzyme YjbQ [Notoacmeibacter sp. MSK16QG-6]MCP1199819.1 secondary thiamine-phosphate synthase enzyme YjbQ [Notoacmeibacter sp. MSK16QG-6]
MSIRQFNAETNGQGLYEITDVIAEALQAMDPTDGLLTVFVRHTSCSLIIQENADPDVVRDLKAFFSRLAPPSDDPRMGWIKHRAEGPDDMPAHIKSALTAVSLSIPVENGKMLLGTWQGIYLFEHRDRPHRRKIVCHFQPDR